MRKLPVYFLLALHLLGNTEFAQFFRLPTLLKHYQQHCQKDSSLDFLQFIAMHYGGDDGDPTDNAEDDQLPCHNRFSTHSYHHTFFSFTPLLSVPGVAELPVAVSVPLTDSRLLAGYDPLFLQPPRLS